VLSVSTRLQLVALGARVQSQARPYHKLILFWNNTPHASDGPPAHHQESKTAHTAPGTCHTGSVSTC